MPYEDEIVLVTELIALEKVPTANPKALATIMVLLHNWMFADAYAGMMLQDLINRSQNPLKIFVKRITGIETSYVTKVSLQNCLDVLAAKHRVFEVLTHERDTWKKMRKLKQELQTKK